MGNTVGSTDANFCNFFSNEKDAYIFGLPSEAKEEEESLLSLPFGVRIVIGGQVQLD